jgi:hypothetical protein
MAQVRQLSATDVTVQRASFLRLRVLADLPLTITKAAFP